MNKEETMFRKRLVELSNQAFIKDIVTFSDFLNLNELHILHTTPKDMFPARYETYGGYDMAERQMVAFLPDALVRWLLFYLMLFIMIMNILWRRWKSDLYGRNSQENCLTGIILAL